ncbi:MAG: hypothetical protein K8J08_20505 [Thermoanaerobaculia bacterium]|nr:hypothetical protein [Thermoanaerobaculia bacterium]
MATKTEYELRTAWPRAEPFLAEQVIEFWRREEAIVDPSVATRRASELLVVALAGSGEIAAVSTARRGFVEQLGFDCFYYRTFVGAEHRRQGLAPRVLKGGFQVLQERFEEGQDPEVLGLLIEAQSPVISGPAGEASWEKRGMPGCVFIGWSPRGNQLRVWYFATARLPEKRPRRIGG